MLFRQHDQCWVAQAPAKVNLFLRVVGKRADGYHEIETVMARINLCDTLVIEPTVEPTLSLRLITAYPPEIRGTAIPETGENLVLRAADRLRQYATQSAGARITLVKRIPPAAGLGGGSSDAAATLAVLNRAWALRISKEELQAIAAELGSDVPFFLATSAYAVCRGRGEQVSPFCAPAGLWLVLARPESGLSTPAVYRGCNIDEDDSAVRPLVAALERGDAAGAAYHLRNGLQPSAEVLSADVVRLRSEFSRLPVCGHQLTGSGSAYFGVCRSHRHAQMCAAQLRSRGIAAVWMVACC